MSITIKKVRWQGEHQALKEIRSAVFLIEQQVPVEDEWDEYDAQADTWHFLAYIDNNAIGTARVILDSSNQTAKIGRVAIIKEQRGKGFATELMLYILQQLTNTAIKTVILDSQLYICELYEKLGFSKQGDIFIDAGIEHQRMCLELSE